MNSDCGCPQLKQEDWHHRKHDWGRRAFYRSSHYILLHTPIGIKAAIRKAVAGIEAAGYTMDSSFMMLDDETGPFTADMLVAIKELPSYDRNVVIWDPTTLYTGFFHGPVSGIRRQVGELERYVESQVQRKPTRVYTWVSNCPRCWELQGGATTILLATY
jgi:hypothetical protein